MGYDLNDIIFPLSLQKSKNQEAKYLVDYVDTDLHFLPQSAATSQDLSSDMSGSLSAANSLRVGDQQQQFLDMIDKCVDFRKISGVFRSCGKIPSIFRRNDVMVKSQRILKSGIPNIINFTDFAKF